MTVGDYVIYNSKLEEAHNTSDAVWLTETFTTARRIIEKGGRVTVMQKFSDASEELVDIIDTISGLEHYRTKYTA